MWKEELKEEDGEGACSAWGKMTRFVEEWSFFG